MEACTLLRLARNDQLEQLDVLARDLLDSAKELLVLSQQMVLNVLLEHITFAFQKIQNKLVNENAVIFRGHTSSIYTVKFSPDGIQLASCSSDNTIQLWHSLNANQDSVTVLRGHSDRVYSIAYSPEGTHIVSGSEDNTVRVWDVQTYEPYSTSAVS
jgi:WD40 repeat protein